MIVAIPSKGRPTKVASKKILTSAKIYVPESEFDAYEKMNQGDVIAVPQEVTGITQTRNWILKSCNDRYVIFVDDDIHIQGYHNMFEFHSEVVKLTEEVWMQEFSKLFDVAEGMNYKIWGVATDGAPRGNYPYKPFMHYSYVTASCMGMINDGSYYFDEDFPVKEDYEICLRHIKERGGILAARYLFWKNYHWTGEGGCKDYRTQDMELAAIKKLMKMYPGMIRRIIRGGSNYSIELNF